MPRVAWILVVCGVAFLGDAAITISQLADFGAASAALARSSNSYQTWVGEVRFTLVFNLCLGILGGVGLALIAIGVWQRRRPARGLALVGGFTLILATLFSLITDASNGGDPDSGRFDIQNLLAPWYSSTHNVLVGLSVIGLVASAIMLFRISSVDFYD